MSIKLLRYLIADAGALKYAAIVLIAMLFVGVEALFLQQYFVIAPTLGGVILDPDGPKILHSGLIILGILYLGRLILALVSSYTQIAFVYDYAAYLTRRAIQISLVSGIWSKQDDRAKIFISPELVATKCLKASLVIAVELMTVVALGTVIVFELQELVLLFSLIFGFFLIVTVYFPNIMLKKYGALRDLADSEMQTGTASILEAPLDHVSADYSKYALKQLYISVAGKYSAIKRYNFVSGISRYILEFIFLSSSALTAAVALIYMDSTMSDIFVATFGLIVAGLRLVPSCARLMQAYLDITFGLPALKNSFLDRQFDGEDIASSRMAIGSSLQGVTINSGKMLDFSDGLRRSVSLEKGNLCVITGEVGSGKSLFLKLLSNRGGEGDLSLSINYSEQCEPRCEDPYYPIHVSTTPFLIRGTLAENVYIRKASDITFLQAQRLKKSLLELSLSETNLARSDNLLQANLSTGNRQIVGLLRAFLSDHFVLLLDEPTGALDPDLEVLVWQMIERENRDRCIVVVTHRAIPVSLKATRISIRSPGVVTVQQSKF